MREYKLERNIKKHEGIQRNIREYTGIKREREGT